jgi:hypothetical protein
MRACIFYGHRYSIYTYIETNTKRALATYTRMYTHIHTDTAEASGKQMAEGPNKKASPTASKVDLVFEENNAKVVDKDMHTHTHTYIYMYKRHIWAN